MKQLRSLSHSLGSVQVSRNSAKENISGKIELAKSVLERKLKRGDIAIAQVLSPEEMFTGRFVKGEVIWETINYKDVPVFDN